MTALILFLVGALFGFHLLVHILQNKPPKRVSLLFHSLFVAAGLVLVIVAISNGERGHIVTALGLLIIAAIGGFVMGYMDVIKKKNPPKALAIAHPIIAVAGVIFLILHIAGME